LLKGLGDDRILIDWFSHVTGPSASHLREEDCYTAALLGCIEAIRSGTTTVLDYMYAHPVPGLSDPIIRAFKEVGIRGILARGVTDRGEAEGIPKPLIEPLDQSLQDFENLFGKYHGKDRISIWLAPIVVWGCTRDALQTVRALASQYHTGITVHVSETPYDRETTRKVHGQTDLSFLESIGFLGPDVLMVHCVQFEDRDIRITKAYDAKVSHNPVSNMYLSSGVAKISRMVESGITVGLATDGAASNNSNDMIETLKCTALLHKVDRRDPTVLTAEKVLEMATIDGARTLGMEKDIGSIEVGKKADLFIFDPKLSPKSTPLHHPVSTLVYSADNRGVDTVMVEGQIVLKGGEFVNIDERKVLRDVQSAADSLVERSAASWLKTRPWRSLAF
jgi:5-methylthioadenosine/S-adenosylhomocysteine deaminase